jgi:hypothetical protein
MPLIRDSLVDLQDAIKDFSSKPIEDMLSKVEKLDMSLEERRLLILNAIAVKEAAMNALYTASIMIELAGIEDEAKVFEKTAKHIDETESRNLFRCMQKVKLIK